MQAGRRTIAHGLGGVRRTAYAAAVVPDLYGLAETAAALGVEKSRISRWRKRGVVIDGWRIPFPEPVLELSATPLWRGSDIRLLRDRLQTSGGTKVQERREERLS